MSLSDDIRDDFLSLWDEMQCLVLIGEVSLKALVTPAPHELELELGGFSSQNALEVRILRSDLSVFPKIGSLLKFEDVFYRIKSISGKQNLPILMLQCQQK